MTIVYDDTHDDLGRIIVNNIPCATYGICEIGFDWEFPIDATLVGLAPYAAINFMQVNLPYVISSSSVVENTSLISVFNSPYDTMLHLNSVLLNRNGPYGFCTWKQLDYHSFNKDARSARESNRITITTHDDIEYSFFENPLTSFSIPSAGKINFVEKAGPDFVSVGSGDVTPSFVNDSIQFENDELFELAPVKPPALQTFRDVKELLLPTKESSKTGFYFDYVTEKEIVVYQGNPERRTLKKDEITRVKHDGSAIVDYLWYGETIYPKRAIANTKQARVRDEILSTEDWRSNTDDLAAYYGINWSAKKEDFLREDTAENSQFQSMDKADVDTAVFNRWPLYSYKNGNTDDQIFSNDPLSISEAGELLGGGVPYDETYQLDYNYLWYTFFGSTASTWAENVIDFAIKPAGYCDAIWRAHIQSNKSPFYGSYEKYFDNVYPHSKGYALIPEWRVSDHIESGVVSSTCSIYGTDETEETFGGCDFYCLDEFEQEISPVAKKKTIKFVLDAFKKFHPYRGFYPVDRSVQIASLLNKSYIGSIMWADISGGDIDISGTNLPAKQTFLSYVMAPGVFYNTIKSGIAVGFPVFNGKRNLIDTNFEFYDFSYLDDGVSDLQNYCYITSPSFYFPFESLLDLKKNLMPVVQKNMASYDLPALWTAPYTICGQYFKTPGEPDEVFAFDSSQPILTLFERANHNFLAEIERFYLNDRTNTYFISKPESEFKDMVAGSVYYMDVVLKQRDCVLTEGPAYSAGNSLRGMVYGGAFSMSSTLPQALSVVEDIAARKADITDPAFGPFCPPYFYGNAVARISFDPLDADPNLQIGQSKKFTLDEILKHSQIRTFKHTNTGGALELSGEFWAYPGADDSVGQLNGLYHEIDWVNALGLTHRGDLVYQDRDSVVPFASTILEAGMMDIDQSVDLFGKKAIYNYDANKSDFSIFSKKINTSANKEFAWCINTKFETPVLDYSMHTRNTLETMPAKVNDEYVYQQYAERTRGVWLDYGALPRKSGGLFLEVRESFPHKIIKNQKILDFDNNIIKDIYEGERAVSFYFSESFYHYEDLDPVDIVCYVVTNFDGDLDGVMTNDPPAADFNIAPFDLVVQKGVIQEVHITGTYTAEANTTSFYFQDHLDPTIKSEELEFATFYNGVTPDPTNGVYISVIQQASSVNKLYNYIVSGTFNNMISKYNEQFDVAGNIIPKFESLIDVCGFEAIEKRIGEIAESREIKEAVVVVPYVEVNGEREYIDIDIDIMNKQIKTLQEEGYSYKTIYNDIIEETTITRLIRLMGEYVFPPDFDFLKNKKINPFVMYVIESKITLNQDDLVDLWQNLLPDSLKTPENERVEISHELEEYEFFHGKGVPNDIKFLVFKVKQKGSWNYYSIKPNINNTVLDISKNNGQNASMLSEDSYNFNWPYDFCSLIEYGKVECHIKFDGI